MDELTTPFQDLVEVAYEATNRSQSATSTTVTLTRDSTEEDTETITLAEHDEASGELVWDTYGVLPGTYEATIATAHTSESMEVTIEPPDIDFDIEETEESGTNYGPPESENPVRVTLTNSLDWAIPDEHVFIEYRDWRGVAQGVVESDGVTDENGEVYMEAFDPTAILPVLPGYTSTLYWTGSDDPDGTRYIEIEFMPVIAASGGTVHEQETDDGLFYVHEYDDAGDDTFFVQSVEEDAEVETLVVAGGGAGGGGYPDGGGGGAGGVVHDDVPVAPGDYKITVGAAGEAEDTTGPGEDQPVINGDDSHFDDLITAIGGGGGGAQDVGDPGGSSGGIGENTDSDAEPALQPDSEWGGYGHRGGHANIGTSTDSGSGGGGAGEPGEDLFSETEGSAGGDGIRIDQFAEFFDTEDGYFAAGGGGGSEDDSSAQSGPGGKGGAGDGASSSNPATSTVPNTGSGGGGGTNDENSSSGADGIVLIRYRVL